MMELEIKIIVILLLCCTFIQDSCQDDLNIFLSLFHLHYFYQLM